MRKLFCLYLLFLWVSNIPYTLWGQSIKVSQESKNEKGCTTYEMKARVIFISPNADLLIDENNGTPMESKTTRLDGQYEYRFICDVTDTNKFKFNIALTGSTSTASVTMFIEEGNELLYTVNVEEVPANISEVKVDPNMLIYPVENKAKATVITTYPKLIVQSGTNESIEGPTYNEETKQFSYTAIFDLTEPASRSTPRTLKLSANGKDFVTQELGVLSPKQAVDIAVIVIQESCYQHNISLAQNYFLNGAYKEAYDIYYNLLNTDECTDKPANTEELEEDLKTMKRLTNAYRLSSNLYNKAEKFDKAGEMDSAMYYHGEAYKYRNYILKRNPSDPYCLEYNSKYEQFKLLFPRIVSGKVVDISRMDLNGNNIPLKDVYIVLSEHERDTKKINGIHVPWYGEKVKGSSLELLGKTDEDGKFEVFVKKNRKKSVFVLNFTMDDNPDVNNKKEFRSKKFIYMPKDVDVEKNLFIKMSPKGLNTYNK